MKLRIPDAWEGRLHSADVRSWLAGFLQHPCPLSPDPGTGKARVSLSVPKRAIKILEGVTGDSASGALRRLIATQLSALPTSSARRPAVVFPGPLPAPATYPALPAPRKVQISPLRSVSGPLIPLCVMGAGSASWDTGYKAAVMRAYSGSQAEASPDMPEIRLFSRSLAIASVVAILGLAACCLWKSSAVRSPVAVVRDFPRFNAWVPLGV